MFKNPFSIGLLYRLQGIDEIPCLDNLKNYP